MSILIALLVLGIIIFVHELGHFTAAKIFRMPVSEFAIGMGPKVYSYNTEKTTYSLRAIPLGGFVNIEGMDEDSDVENGFSTKPAYARFIVLIAGVFMNFLLAFIILFFSLYQSGIYVMENRPIIGDVFKNVKAKNFIKPGDEILKIDGIEIKNWEEISKAILKRKNNDFVNVELKRDKKVFIEDVPLTKDEKLKTMFLGVVPHFNKEKISILEASKLSIKSGVKLMVDTVNGFKLVITGKVKTKELTGPIGIIKVVGDASKKGFKFVLWLMALISVNIGVLNLLPLPALDGGRIIFVLLEMFKIKVNKNIEEKIHLAGMIFLFALIIFITTNDIFNLVK